MKPASLKSTLLVALALLGTALTAVAGTVTLDAATAVKQSGNPGDSSFFNVQSNGTTSGLMSASYLATLGGDANTGFWVLIDFNGAPKPTLTGAFLKAANFYLSWDATALALFNIDAAATSLKLWNTGDSGIWHLTGGRNPVRKYHDTSHAGINGTPGMETPSQVPDSGVTALLLGLGLAMLVSLKRSTRR